MSGAMDEGGKSSSSNKIVAGIKNSGGHVISGIRSGTGKVASGGNKAIHAISSPIESAVRKTVDKANNSLHRNNSSHSTASAKENSTVDNSNDEDSTLAIASGNLAETAPEEIPSTMPASEKTTDAPSEGQEDQTLEAGTTETDASLTDSKRGGFLGSVENVTNKLFVAPVKGAAEKVAEGGNKLFVTPVKGASKKAKEVFRTGSRGASKDLDVDVEADVDLPDVPPDDTLKKMNVIIDKQLRNVSIRDYYATAWSEGDGTSRLPLYGPWLKESGKQEINVGKWEFADDETGFVGDWDGEKYSQKRIVTFVFNKQIPFQMGPTLAKVKHTQYCRVEGNDRCVLGMEIEMNGVPYSDCFKVEIRWVATRSGKEDLAIQVGLFVNFVKSTIMASKIRSGTIEQTTQQQVQLFRTIKQACGSGPEEAVAEPKEEQQDVRAGHYHCTWLSNVLPFMHRDALADRNDEIAISAKSADRKMKEVMTVLSDKDPTETDPDVLTQLVVVNDALDKILST